MFQFGREQRIFDISGVRVGGQPGQLPTVLVGSIFYHGNKIVEDPVSGKFDEERAEERLKTEEEMSDKTGNPRIVDVCCSWPQAFEKFIGFVADKVDGPFSIDGSTLEVKLAGARYVAEVGLSERTVYNSITLHTTEAEMDVIRESKIKSAIFLALNPKKPTIAGRLEVVDNLLEKADRAGIESILIDTTVLDIPDPGPTGKAIYLVKERYGLPAGCGAHNAIAMWRKRGKLDKEEMRRCAVVANVLPIAMGADFILYGPIEWAAEVYVPCAVADAYVAYSMRQEYGVKPLTKDHPLFKVF